MDELEKRIRGTLLLVMEFVKGDTLSHFIKQGPMPRDRAVQFAVQIADALSAAHAKDTISRLQFR